MWFKQRFHAGTGMSHTLGINKSELEKIHYMLKVVLASMTSLEVGFHRGIFVEMGTRGKVPHCYRKGPGKSQRNEALTGTMASDDRLLRQWVSDQLMSLMGYSEPVLVKYIIRISKEASSPADIVSKFMESGSSLSAETHSFAEKIFAQVPHKQMGVSSYQKQEKEAAMLVRKQKTYKLLDADDEDDDYVAAKVAASQSGESDSHRKHFRRKSEDPDIDNDEVETERGNERQVRRRTYKSDEDGDSF